VLDRRRLSPVGLLLLAGVFAACGGGDSGDRTAESLKPRLPAPSSVPGYHLQRTFDWSNPVDLVGEGLRLPEATHPSAGVQAFEDANVQGGAGERLVQGTPPDESEVTIGVVKLKSDSGALAARDWMHKQDLRPPCYSSCIYNTMNLAIPGVPNATAAKQVPNITPPPADPADGPPSHYHFEFTVGPYLYFATSDGGPDDEAQVIAGAQGFYRQVRTLSN
jgi:hypothetical protein